MTGNIIETPKMYQNTPKISKIIELLLNLPNIKKDK